MTPSRAILNTVLFVSALAVTPSAHAFKILSALTEGCHEKITLGVFQQAPAGPFLGDSLPSVQPMLARFIARAQADGVPSDDGTRGLIRETSRRYGWSDKSDAEIFIYASFLAGTRAPDTGGHSIVDFSQIRGSHIRDDEQSAHFLRRKEDDGSAGDLNVIAETKNRIRGLANSAFAEWTATGSAVKTERWTFAFYGERDVMVFAPAYDLGLIAHAIQDSYAHAIRDENTLKVLAVENYLDLMFDQHDVSRDGPGHSERLDQCNPNDAFDAPRINIARKQTARVFDALDAQMAASGTDLTALETVMNDVFDYQAGCDASNQFCNSLWYRKALEEISEPYEIGCGLVRTHHDSKPKGPGAEIKSSLLQNAMIFLLVAILPMALALGLRRRIRL